MSRKLAPRGAERKRCRASRAKRTWGGRAGGSGAAQKGGPRQGQGGSRGDRTPRGASQPLLRPHVDAHILFQDPSATGQWARPGPAAPQPGEKPRGAHWGVAVAGILATWSQPCLCSWGGATAPARDMPGGGSPWARGWAPLPGLGLPSRAGLLPPRAAPRSIGLCSQRVRTHPGHACGNHPGTDSRGPRLSCHDGRAPGRGGPALLRVRVLDASGAHTPSDPTRALGSGSLRAARGPQGHMLLGLAQGSELCPRKPGEGLRSVR